MKKPPLWIIGVGGLFISLLAALGGTVVPSIQLWFFLVSLFSLLGGIVGLTVGITKLYEDY